MVVPVGSVSWENIDDGFAAQIAANEEAIDDLLKNVATHLRDDAKRTADFIDRTGNLRKSIGMRKSKFINGGYIAKASGRNRANGATGAKGFHAWLVEFGHVKVLWGRRTNGHVAPRPFMRNATMRANAYAAQKIAGMRG